MGVYIFKSKHRDFIKIGHYCKYNAWSRIAHRGFYSVKRPDELTNNVGVEDMELIYWFPNLNMSDEKRIIEDLKKYKIIGEWFSTEALKDIDKYNYDNQCSKCDKEQAMKTRYRL